MNIKETLLEYLKVIIITIIVTNIVLFFIQISRVVGESMEPNYHDGNIVLINKVFYQQQDVDYGDVIVAKADFGDGEEQIIKRVIGKPGDTISCKDNKMYRNNELLQEDYILEEMWDDDWSVTVRDGHLFIMGDNRNNSSDSREIGDVDFEKDIVGQVFVKLF